SLTAPARQAQFNASAGCAIKEPCFTAVAAKDAADDGKPCSWTGAGPMRVETPEHAKGLFSVFRRKSHAVVADANAPPSVRSRTGGNGDFELGVRLSELQGVGDRQTQRTSHQVLVTH